jgi:exodeoxyribonuclease V alpha subunit
MWAHFGPDLYAVLGNGDVERLAELLDRNQAAIVVEAWRFQQALADCVVFFDEHGIDVSVSRKALDFWGDEAVRKIRENPYRLLTVCSWKTVDHAAKALGYPADHRTRRVAAVESILYDRLDQKHTWCDRDTLLALVARRLGATPGGAAEAIELAVADGAAIRVDGGYQPAGAAYMERFIETCIEKHLCRIAVGDLFLDGIELQDVDSFLEDFDPLSRLTSEQRDAVRMSLTNSFSLLVGGAGVGKTTTLKAVNAAARHVGMNVFQIAVAGRAASRMAEATGQPAQTIASWLQGVADGRIELGRHTLIVVDEASMLDLPTLYRILFHLPDGARCLLVGDAAQLPPIGFGLTLHRLLGESRIPQTALTRILRASEASGIPQVSVAIRNGRVPPLANYSPRIRGCSFLEVRGRALTPAIEDVVHDLAGEEVQVVAAVYGGPSGIDAINAHFHRLKVGEGHACLHGFAIGEPCIWTVNDYDRRIWNGSMGSIADLTEDAVAVRFGQETHRVPQSEIGKLSLAYCISVHKAQGSQFANVVVPLQQAAIMDRAMLYTGLTRAVERAILVGTWASLDQAIRPRPRSLHRQVALALR